MAINKQRQENDAVIELLKNVRSEMTTNFALVFANQKIMDVKFDAHTAEDNRRFGDLDKSAAETHGATVEAGKQAVKSAKTKGTLWGIVGSGITALGTVGWELFKTHHGIK